ncbi:MAG: signal peptidase I [Geothrix sp.]|uniref:signal peptidase I n=1 Tax=Geothrix sp. TaxID=1962974 RepID=UPI0017F470D2|nr:signal peptidase I [Geothrix sp.]NWJ41819.1 signal peptidase I [Geothrix sp.]WIL20204.1 MAG: signal peptidase I [Geothrix sp.]
MRPWIPLAAVVLAVSPLAVVHPVRVAGRSMEPALRDDDLRWALRAWISHAPRRGEVWIVAGPTGSSAKRVIGLPGEAVTWRGPDVWIDGQRLDEPWVTHPERSGQGTLTCGAGFLVLGDNRPESQDGRRWGPLPPTAMQGRIL